MNLSRKVSLLLLLLLFPVLSHAEVFSSMPLTQKYQKSLIKNKLWHSSCPIPFSRLRNVTVSYYDFEGKAHDDGHLIVLDAVSNEVISIFKELYIKKFPIAKIKPSSDYQGDDQLSMIDNNSSSFNCRAITNGSTPSIHAYGLAIDINTLQNPYISFSDKTPGEAEVSPAKGTEYLNRHNIRAGMAEIVAPIFQKHGFNIWGGKWNTPIDYQHFQTSRFMAQMLASLYTEDLKILFQLSVKYPEISMKFKTEDVDGMLALYNENRDKFFQKFTPPKLPTFA